MSRTFASAVALFAASVLVFSSALFLTFGTGNKPASAPTPAALNQIEPQSGGTIRPGRIGSDMTAVIRNMESRADGEAGVKQPPKELPPGAMLDTPSAASTPPATPKTAAKPLPSGTMPNTLVNAPPSSATSGNAPASTPTANAATAGPSPKLLRALNPGGQTPSEPAPAAPVLTDYQQPAQQSGTGPTSLLPRRGGAAPAAEGSAYRPAPQPARAPSTGRFPPSYTASMPSGALPPPADANFRPGALAAQPGYTAAPMPAPGQGPSFIPQNSLDEANLTADQLNERELQRIRKWRETTPGAAQPTQ